MDASDALAIAICHLHTAGTLRRQRAVAQIVARLAELEQRYGERFRPDPGWTSLALDSPPV